MINDNADNQQIPVITPSDALSGSEGFGNNEYGKAALGYLAMKDMLGDELFKNVCMLIWKDGMENIPFPGISFIRLMMLQVKI
jgi:hypothetical protein